MSGTTLFAQLRPNGQWSKEARRIYTTKVWLRYLKKYPVWITIISLEPTNRQLWDGFYRFFYRHFPVRTDTYTEYGKEKVRHWNYNEETFDPKWDRLIHVHQADWVYQNLIRPYLQLQASEIQKFEAPVLHLVQTSEAA